ncbi:hypothetical protein PR003_g10380 [Phytophthora rubi]|uniref:Uncharacterized protein n=1 Tax=Phytophthora rubi TaxID=129364 RepID=A0A6A3M656_9STRA|nr:hypothetical protein PR002_g11241 [Phytophthora rubi]KAE9027651.1 hypothetical protein PR001_g11923 [Phytophthora rubi]KAE9340654.1 hypothetical protein PR003_g10380 [Phytophthora rubi]
MQARLSLLPEECAARVAIKIGEPQMDYRTTHSSHEVVFKVAEGYAVLRERLKRLLTSDSAVTWDCDTGIYAKATVNARQREYKRVPDDDQAFNQFFSAI